MLIAILSWLLAIPLLGVTTGLRAMTPMAVLCWFAYLGYLPWRAPGRRGWPALRRLRRSPWLALARASQRPNNGREQLRAAFAQHGPSNHKQKWPVRTSHRFLQIRSYLFWRCSCTHLRTLALPQPALDLEEMLFSLRMGRDFAKSS